jgi:hypothetical protein
MPNDPDWGALAVDLLRDILLNRECRLPNEYWHRLNEILDGGWPVIPRRIRSRCAEMNGAALFSAGAMAGAIIVAIASGVIFAASPQEADAESMCMAFGGARKETWSKETTTAHTRRRTVSVDCQDGSWVMRGIDK